MPKYQYFQHMIVTGCETGLLIYGGKYHLGLFREIWGLGVGGHSPLALMAYMPMTEISQMK